MALSPVGGLEINDKDVNTRNSKISKGALRGTRGGKGRALRDSEGRGFRQRAAGAKALG